MEKPIHDGVSPIYVEDGEETVQFQRLWDYLVPPYGRAQFAQGELIRIAGRVNHEIWDNGSINWDDDFRKMLAAFPKYLSLGNAFSPEDIEAAEFLVSLLKDGQDLWEGPPHNCGKFCATLCSCAIAWVRQNPQPLPPLEADYNR